MTLAPGVLALILALAAGSTHPVCAEPGAEPAQAPTTPAAVTAPGDFESLDRWLDYKRASRRETLPIEARVYFRRALLARQSGARDEAMRLAHGAVGLDPTFLEARWSLICWEAPRDFSQALAQSADLVDLVRRDFSTQWSLAGNALYLLFYGWVLALIATAALIVIAQNALLRHALQERFQQWATPASSRTWTWALLLAPFALGFGVALPLVAYLAALWRGLKVRERAVTVLLAVTLAATPFATPIFDRLALPMRTDESPIATLVGLEADPHAPAAQGELESLAGRFPGDPYVRFGAGWVAQNSGNWVAAETAYRDVLARWPGDDSSLDNLGSALAQQGRRDEAIRSYEQAVKSNPQNATAYFNLSQGYTQAYDFEAAGRAMTRASALDFDRVREYKNQPARAGSLDPVAEWISARRFWMALTEGPLPLEGGSLPPLVEGRLETSGRRFSLAVPIAVIVGLLLGFLLHRGLPVHRCANCDRVVCRRCSERRRAQALCRGCARVAGAASSPDFARILLARERQRSTRWASVARIAFGIAVPGAGLVMHRRVWRALLLLWITAGLSVAYGSSPWPFAGRPRFEAGAGITPLALAVASLCVYVPSWLGLLAEQRRAHRRAVAERPVRARRSDAGRVGEDDRTPVRREAA